MPQNYILLQSISLNTTASSFTFNNIPQSGYTDLKVVISGRDSSSAGGSWNGYSFTILPNGLNTNLSQRSLFGNGSSTGAYADTSIFTPVTMSADTANSYSNIEITVSNYLSAYPKAFRILGVTETNGNAAATRIAGGLWNSSSTISSLQFTAYSTWTAGTTFSLYGIAALGTTPALPKATGGDVIANDGTYWYHAFKSSGTFTVNTALTNVDFLVVAGGGGAGGGNTGSAGGGAGGLRTSAGTSGGGAAAESKLSLSVGSYPVVVGGGGNGGMFYAPGSTQISGTNGTNSSFHTITSIGGGVGGGFSMSPAGPGIAGGSGGGGAGEYLGSANPGGLGTANQGYAGGPGFTDNATYRSFGGGGGAGAAGASGGTGNTGGAGGAGVLLTAMSTATYTGVSGYYAGGGGGSNGAGVGAGGAGGGGAGGGNNGVANTGGGGGGANSATTQSGRFTGHGGSGIVIIKYAMA